MADDQDPLDDELDPTEDTPDSENEDTDAADEPDPSDPEERQKEAQRTITRLSQENARLKELAEASDDDDEDDEASDPQTAKFEQESWALAETLYGEAAIDAYGAAYRLLRNATTPADHVAAFEAYHEARTGKGKSAPKAAATDDALEPKDTDLGPDLQKADKKLTEARKGGKLEDFASAAAARMGFGG